MSVNAGIGLGTVFKVGGNAIAEVHSISPSIDFDDIDVTDFDSPAQWREYIKGLGACELSLELHFRPDTHKSDVLTHLTTTAAQTMRIEWRDGTNWDFDGYLQGFDGEGPTADKLSATLRVRVTGSVDFDGP